MRFGRGAVTEWLSVTRGGPFGAGDGAAGEVSAPDIAACFTLCAVLAASVPQSINELQGVFDGLIHVEVSVLG